MDLTTSDTLKATCKLLGVANAIVLGILLVLAAIVMAHNNVFGGIQLAISAVIGFFVGLFCIRCGECLAEIHNHFCRVEGLDRERR